MTLTLAVQTLVLGAGRAFPLLDTRGLRTLFPDDDDNAFHAGLRRLVRIGLLERVARGVYLNRALPHLGGRGIGTVAQQLRPDHLVYLSGESALAEVGSMSQVPMRAVVATTGTRGVYTTPYGDIEFTHTGRSLAEILQRTTYDERWGMRVAEPRLAHEDLRRLRRNLHLVDPDVHADVLAEWDEA